MGFWGAAAKIGGVLIGHAVAPGAGGLITGGLIGSAVADVIDPEDEPWSNLTRTTESPSTWLPLTMPNMTAGGSLTAGAIQKIGAPYKKGQEKERQAAIDNATAAARSQALQYMLMSQTGGGGGGGGMSLPMLMMMQQNKGKF